MVNFYPRLIFMTHPYQEFKPVTWFDLYLCNILVKNGGKIKCTMLKFLDRPRIIIIIFTKLISYSKINLKMRMVICSILESRHTQAIHDINSYRKSAIFGRHSYDYRFGKGCPD